MTAQQDDDEDPCGGTGTVECWSPGGPCETPNDPDCECCGECLACLHAGRGRMATGQPKLTAWLSTEELAQATGLTVREVEHWSARGLIPHWRAMPKDPAAVPIKGRGSGYARRYAPVDTGHLRDSIHVHSETPRTARISAEAHYAGYVEFGTENMHPQPFMRPALYKKRPLR